MDVSVMVRYQTTDDFRACMILLSSGTGSSIYEGTFQSPSYQKSVDTLNKILWEYTGTRCVENVSHQSTWIKRS